MVPDVDCVNVLKKVPELQCTPEVFRECNDVEKKIPYLEEAEDCVEVTFDECQEVEINVLVNSNTIFYFRSSREFLWSSVRERELTRIPSLCREERWRERKERREELQLSGEPSAKVYICNYNIIVFYTLLFPEGKKKSSTQKQKDSTPTPSVRLTLRDL